jgi:hypothetical protein
MSSWAEIDSNNKVIRVLRGDNDDPAGDEGYQWLLDNLGGNWVKTSFSNSIRYNFAGIGMTYDPIADAFIGPKWECGHPELILNTTNYRWTCDNDEHKPNV